jgi:catalase-peroxidase
MKLDHFPRIDDAYIGNGKKSRTRSESNMDAKTDDKSAGKCPVVHKSFTNRDWWPDHLNIGVLHHNSPLSDPMGKAFDYAKMSRPST